MQWANAKSVKNLGGLTARLDILVSGSLAWTYTWSRYEVLPLFHYFMVFFVPGLMMDLGGILTGLAGYSSGKIASVLLA